jgi:subtilase family protein
MHTQSSPSLGRLFCAAFSVLIAISFAGQVLAKRAVPENLSNGLDKLVESNVLIKGGAPALFNGFATKQAANIAKLALTDKITGKYVVDIMPDGRVPFATLRASLQSAFPLLEVKNVDANYAGHGVLEGLVHIDDVPAIAYTTGVGSVILQIKPVLNAGPSTSQGVNQHRVNRINKGYNPAAPLDYPGTGISIGVMSDSFDASAATTDRAAADTLAGELPSVIVLEDLPLGSDPTDEGRGMAQIVYDVAPGSKLAFATAFGGEVAFANNIRALAGLPGYEKAPGVQQGFKGDIVCDDVSYLTEPMFSDGIIAQAVNQVVASGVTYASSAANNWGTDGYASNLRIVPTGAGKTAATNPALAGTNLDLTGVDPNLYAGGFHNFNPNGLDVAQTINTSDAAFVFQWNDPYDVSVPTIVGAPIFEGDGTSAGGTEVSFMPPPFVAGQAYVIQEMATPATPIEDFDAIVRITDPNGHIIVDQDTGVDETVTFFAPVSGQYTITVHPFTNSTTMLPTQGSFHVKVFNATGTARITQDLNILFFDMDGKFLPDLSFTSNNIANNRPVEFAAPSFPDAQAQIVVTRSNTTAPDPAADRFRYVFFGNGASGIGPAEYNSYVTPVTYGHSAAAGANSVAAYEAFKPNIPEDFTSLGPVTIFFDDNYNRLATPEVRLKPDLAAADGVNTSFFPLGVIPFMGVPIVGDSQYDPDNFPNFYGTSAASPHCAGLAALLLQAHGGTGSLTPAQVKAILQSTTFPHDLDPYSVNGSAQTANGGSVSINVTSDNDRNMGTGQNDPNSWSVAYSGPGQLTSLSFNPQGTPQTGGNPTGGNFNGFTPADFLDSSKYHYTPGMVFTSTFNFGDKSVGLAPADVVPSRSNPAPFPSNPSPGNTTQHMWTLNLNFPNNNFTTGKVLRFNNGRSQWQDATVPQGMTTTVFVRKGDYSADILGDGVLIPEDPLGNNVLPGMTFSGTVTDGGKTYTFEGRLANRIGRGYSPLDGFGHINIEAAVTAPIPTATPAASPPGVQLVNIAGRLLVGTGNDVGIGGFIMKGAASKKVLIRALGPSLSGAGIANPLEDPVLELHEENGTVIVNDNWRSSNEGEIQQSGLAPSENAEAAIIATLPPGNHTAIIKGAGNTTGVGIVEIYDLETPIGDLGNLSVRANIQTGDNALIAGVIISAGDPRRVVFRGIGPSLKFFGVPAALDDTTLEVRDVNGVILGTNDNWQDASNASDISATGLAPNTDEESVVLTTLGPGQYTAIVRGANDATGVGLAEVYKLDH